MFSILLVWTILALLLRFFYVFFVKLFFNWRYYYSQGIKGEGVFPILGLPYWYRVHNVKKYGDAFHELKQSILKNPDQKFAMSNIGSTMLLMITDPKIAREFYSEKRKHYVKDSLSFDIIRQIGDNTLFAIEGNLWKKHRRVISDMFHFGFLTSMIPVIENIATENFNSIENLNDVEAIDFFQVITGSTVGKLFLGVDLSTSSGNGYAVTQRMAKTIDLGLMQRANPLVNLFGAGIIKYGLIEQHRRLIKDTAWCKEYAKNVLAAKREQLNSQVKDNDKRVKGIFDLLLEYNAKEGLTKEEIFSDDEMIDEFLGFFMAGMDTSGHLLTFICYYLLKYPEIKTTIMAELDRELKGKTKGLTHDDLNRLEYFNAFVKESLRLTPQTNMIFPIKANEDHYLGDIHIKQGTFMTVSLLALGVHPKHYQEPLAFRPERWLNPDELKNIDPFVDIAFSAGARNCIGQHIAKLMVKLTLIELLTRFDFEITDPNYELKITTRILMEPLNPIHLKLIPRK